MKTVQLPYDIADALVSTAVGHTFHVGVKHAVEIALRRLGQLLSTQCFAWRAGATFEVEWRCLSYDKPNPARRAILTMYTIYYRQSGFLLIRLVHGIRQ